MPHVRIRLLHISIGIFFSKKDVEELSNNSGCAPAMIKTYSDEKLAISVLGTNAMHHIIFGIIDGFLPIFSCVVV